MRRGTSLWLTAVVSLAGASWPMPSRGAEPLPDSRLGMRTAPLLLLSRADVQADLGMTREQVADADQAITTLYLKAKALRGKSGQEVIAARRAIDEEHQRWFESRLSEEQ